MEGQQVTSDYTSDKYKKKIIVLEPYISPNVL